MAKQRAPLEFTSLSGGLVTEANALTFPDRASLDELNFELSRSGERKRRLGIQYQDATLKKDLGLSYTAGAPSTLEMFLWENVAGVSTIDLLVVQTDNTLHFYTTDTDVLAEGELDFTYDAEETFSGNTYGMAAIDGRLVVVTGSYDIITLDAIVEEGVLTGLQDPPTIERLTMRDLFGVDVDYNIAVEGADPTDFDPITITDPEYATKRPKTAGFGEDGTALSTFTASKTRSKTVTGERVGSRDYTQVTATEFSPAKVLGYEILEVYSKRIENRTPKLYFVFKKDFPREELRITDSFSGEATLLERWGSSRRTLRADVPVSSHAAWLSKAGQALTFDIESIEAKTKYTYNLRNQTFANKRLPKAGDVTEDPITSFINESGLYPAMSDTVLAALYNNLDATNKSAERFHAEDLVVDLQGTAPAPKGYFIIDALDRHTDRKRRWQELVDDQGYSDDEVVDLSIDQTPGGATVVAEYSGRVWYGGFSEKGTQTEDGGISLESKLLYSQVSSSKAALTRCYQEGDPTSKDAPELLATDGGFLSLDGAVGITKLVPIGNSLLVLASNGVWAVTGADGNYFTPTSPRVQKITDVGVLGRRSLVVIDSAIVYWSKRGIYLVQATQAGAYEVKNISESTIQTLYQEIPYADKVAAVGAYDTYESTVIWAYNNSVTSTGGTKLLKMQTTTGAFTVHEVQDGDSERTLVGPLQVPQFTQSTADVIVVVGSDIVEANSETVVVDGTDTNDRPSDVVYSVVEDVAGVANLSFATFTEDNFKDWGEVDAPAYMVTGYVSGGDFQRYKQVPYITFHFERTEDGFFADTNGDLQLSNPSGCLVQAQWDWANSVNSGRWGREFQAYRYKQLYMPVDVNDTFDTGYSTIVTKNKIRGKGRVLSLKMSTEEGKDCRILGWSAIMGVNSSV